MIKTRKGKVTVKGSAGELLADLGVIATAMYNDVLLPELPAEEAKSMILDTVELAMLPEQEVEKRMKEKLLRALSEIAEKTKEAIEANEKEEDE